MRDTLGEPARPMTVWTVHVYEERSFYEGHSLAASQYQRVRTTEEAKAMIVSQTHYCWLLGAQHHFRWRLMHHHDCLRPCDMMYVLSIMGELQIEVRRIIKECDAVEIVDTQIRR